jgi:hypothetical protein
MSMLDLSLEHEAHHRTYGEWMTHAINQHRDRIGLDTSWVIDPRVCCPQEMPGQEGSIWWDAQVSYARVMLRCDLPAALRLWVVVHELYELLLWETGDLFMTTCEYATRAQRFQTHLQQEYQSARNRQIERLVYRHLGYKRPGHLVEESSSAHSSQTQPLSSSTPVLA